MVNHDKSFAFICTGSLGDKGRLLLLSSIGELLGNAEVEVLEAGADNGDMMLLWAVWGARRVVGFDIIGGEMEQGPGIRFTSLQHKMEAWMKQHYGCQDTHLEQFDLQYGVDVLKGCFQKASPGALHLVYSCDDGRW